MLVTAMSVMELSIAVVSVIGALGACLHGSKCTSCKVGCSGCELHRDVSAGGTDRAGGASSGAVASDEPEQPSTNADDTPPEPFRDTR